MSNTTTPSINRFTSSFNKYACPHDTIIAHVEGFDIVATIVQDDSWSIDDDDTHNVDQTVTGCSDEQQKKLLANRKAWFNGEWFYCGIVLSVKKNGIELTNHARSLWGIECNYPGFDNSYLTEVANELLDDALDEGKKVLAKLVETN